MGVGILFLGGLGGVPERGEFGAGFEGCIEVCQVLLISDCNPLCLAQSQLR